MRIICLASLLFVSICWAAKEEVKEFGDNECQSKGSDLHESVARDSDNICGVDSESIASAKSKNKAGKNDQKDSICRTQMGIERVNGTFVNGLLTGSATLYFEKQSILRAQFKKGVISGLSRLFTCQYGVCDFTVEAWNQLNWLSQVVFYSNGKKIGPAWEFKIGGGLLVGHVDQRGELTGEDLVYAYPDFTTLLVGKFSSGIMMGAKQTTLTGIKFDKITKVPYILYDKKLLQASKQVFAFQEPTKTSVGLDPLVQGPMLQNFFADPYEKQMMYIDQSKVPGAGFGAFAKRSAKKGTLVGFYSGIKVQNLDQSTLSSEGRRSQYRIDNDWALANEVIDIPNKYRSVLNYNATLGHILNHSPTPNAWYGMVDHPKFGKIRSIVLSKDVQAGEELFCNYGYLDTYVKSEATLKTLFRVAKMIMNKEDDEFVGEIKRGIKYIKSRSDEIEPYINMAQSVAALFGKK